MKSDVITMSQYEWLLLIRLSIVWGGSFFFVGVAVEALPPLTIVALKVSLATHTCQSDFAGDSSAWRTT